MCIKKFVGAYRSHFKCLSSIKKNIDKEKDVEYCCVENENACDYSGDNVSSGMEVSLRHNIFMFRRKGCGYSSWWITIKAKFFRLSHDVVTCDVDRDVSTAYC